LDCALKRIVDPKISDTLPFLKLKKGKVTVSVSDFSCCSGEGRRFSKDHQYSVMCDLKRRITEVKALYARMCSVWGFAHTIPLLQALEFKKYWQWFVYYKYNEIFKGYVVTNNDKRESPSILWSLANIAVWRFGFAAYVHTIGKSNFFDLVNFLQRKEKLEEKCILFVEVYSGLWNLSSKEEFSFIINWCEKSLSPLWLCFYEQHKLTTAQHSSAMKLFQKRIIDRKNKPKLSWLASDSRSKLTSICLECDQYL
jgi:hypothetical protein